MHRRRQALRCYTIISVTLTVGWMAALGAFGMRAYRVIGSGSTEYKLVADASVRVFGLTAIAALLF